MLAVPKYDRFWNDATTPSETAAMSSNDPVPPPPIPPGDEPETGTTFCTLIPKMPQWKFAGPSGFLSRSPSSANKELSASGKSGSGSGLAAVLSACEPVCATPCSLPVMSRLRGGSGGGRKAPRAEGHKPGGDEWSRKGSFISKPVQGWLHPDERVLSPGVSYVVRYMGCIEILRSMRSLDFTTRTQVTREAINRLYEAVPGVKGTWKKKAPNKALFSILGKSNLHFAGLSIVVNISIDGLNLMIPTTRQDTTDYVAYVAKDPINQRACHILECCNGLAQSVISTVGQAFELRFKQYLHSPPKTVTPQERSTGTDEAGWGEEEEASEHDYYNSIPGKEPPLGGLVDSRLHHSASLGNVPFSYSSHFSQVTPALPALLALPALPILPALPVLPILPALPSLPAGPALPARPTHPALPALPARPALPTLPALPVLPARPALPALPALPPCPACPALPTLPVLPALPVLRILPALPTLPSLPAHPALPAHLARPALPARPAHLTLPNLPVLPTLPAHPTLPACPTHPALPARLTLPACSACPARPVLPALPARLALPALPILPTLPTLPARLAFPVFTARPTLPACPALPALPILPTFPALPSSSHSTHSSCLSHSYRSSRTSRSSPSPLAFDTT
nr:PREDICTED: SHC-transforming protein 2 isoform X2 [Anolis carolinensis]|eukprot:XP_016854449.1 PREDICTED: SHC-transforming protein 2 isoform X2 [Anolis carolinensis]